MQNSAFRQTDSTYQIGALGDILSDRRVLFVHRSHRGNKSDNAAVAHLVKRLCEKVIMRVSRSELERLDRMSEDTNRSRNELINILLTAAVDIVSIEE